MQRLTGRWVGTYHYVEPEVDGPRRVEFTLVIFGGSSWRFWGDVLDDPTTGIEGRGTISGRAGISGSKRSCPSRTLVIAALLEHVSDLDRKVCDLSLSLLGTAVGRHVRGGRNSAAGVV